MICIIPPGNPLFEFEKKLEKEGKVMHKKIEKVSKDLSKGQKDVKSLKKADVKMDKKMSECKAKKKK